MTPPEKGGQTLPPPRFPQDVAIGWPGRRTPELPNRAKAELERRYRWTLPIRTYERTIHCLARAQIRTFGDTAQMHDDDLLSIVNFGPKCLAVTRHIANDPRPWDPFAVYPTSYRRAARNPQEDT